MTSVFGPLLAVFLSQSIIFIFNEKIEFRVFIFLGFLSLLLVAVSISGARAYSAYINYPYFRRHASQGSPVKPYLYYFSNIIDFNFSNHT